MRILKEKSKLKAILKRSVIFIIICYLLASWGVNGVINPIHYYRNIIMHEEEIIPVREGNNIILDCSESREPFEYLSFRVTDSYNIFFDIKVNTSAKDAAEMVVGVHQGLNTIKIPDDTGVVMISADTMDENGVLWDAFVLSDHRKVDSAKMMEILVSMLLLLALWEGVQYIKNRYTK